MHFELDDRFRDAAYLLRVFMAVEKEFDIQITDFEACDIETFDDLIKIIQEKEVTNGSRL
jgi:acyl carrier protein